MYGVKPDGHAEPCSRALLSGCGGQPERAAREHEPLPACSSAAKTTTTTPARISERLGADREVDGLLGRDARRDEHRGARRRPGVAAPAGGRSGARWRPLRRRGSRSRAGTRSRCPSPRAAGTGATARSVHDAKTSSPACQASPASWSRRRSSARSGSGSAGRSPMQPRQEHDDEPRRRARPRRRWRGRRERRPSRSTWRRRPR